MNEKNDSDTMTWKDRFDETSGGADAPGADSGNPPPHDLPHEEAARAAQAGEGGPDRGDPLRMPRPTFSTFVLSLASSALVQLGEVPDPATGETREDIALAKQSIDILSMLQDKTKNGLDNEESRLIEGLLYELRMKFVMKN